MQALYIRGRKAARLDATDGVGEDLPGDLVIPPGIYRVGAKNYPMRREGLYRFLNPQARHEQRIVYRKDRPALMSAISWLATHGYRDNGSAFDDLTERMLHGKAILTCGDMSRFVVTLFNQLDIPCRIVRGRTLEDPNGFNDGHILTEVELDGRWIAFDPDRGRTYSSQGRLLNLLELVTQLQTGEVRENVLSAAIPLAVGCFSKGASDYELWMETWLAADPVGEFLRRPLGVPIIAEGGREFYTTIREDQRERFETSGHHDPPFYLTPTAFRRKFYPDLYTASLLIRFCGLMSPTLKPKRSLTIRMGPRRSESNLRQAP